jgi:hypothetical protein
MHSDKKEHRRLSRSFQWLSAALVGRHFNFLSKRNRKVYIEFEILTVVVMKSTVILGMRTCSPLELNLLFGGTYSLHLPGRKISQARYQREGRWQVYHPKDGSDVPPKRWLAFNGLFGVISQKIALLKSM